MVSLQNAISESLSSSYSSRWLSHTHQYTPGPPILASPGAHEESSCVERGEPITRCEQKSGGFDSTNHKRTTQAPNQDLFIETTTIDSTIPYHTKARRHQLGIQFGSMVAFSIAFPVYSSPTSALPSTLIPGNSHPTNLSHALPRSLENEGAEIMTQGRKIPRWVQRSDRTTDSVSPHGAMAPSLLSSTAASPCLLYPFRSTFDTSSRS